MARFLFPQWDGGRSRRPELTIVRRLVEAVGHGAYRRSATRDRAGGSSRRRDGLPDVGPGAPPRRCAAQRTTHTRDWEVRNPLNIIPNMMDKLFVEAGAAVCGRDAGRHRRRPARRRRHELPAVRLDDGRRGPRGAVRGARSQRRLAPRRGDAAVRDRAATGQVPARPCARPRVQRPRRPAVEQGPTRAQPRAGVLGSRSARPAAGAVRAARPRPGPHRRRVRLPGRAAAERPLRRPAARRAAVGRAVDPARPGRPSARPGRDEHDVHGSPGPAPARGHGARQATRPRPGDHRACG